MTGPLRQKVWVQWRSDMRQQATWRQSRSWWTVLILLRVHERYVKVGISCAHKIEVMVPLTCFTWPTEHGCYFPFMPKLYVHQSPGSIDP